MQLLVTPCDILDVTRTQEQNSDSVWVSLAALGSSQLHFDNVSWQCLLACGRFNLCFNKQQIFGRFPCKQTWPAVECCLQLCNRPSILLISSTIWPGAVSGLSLLLFCQKATKERTEEKTPRLLHPSQVAYIMGSMERARYATKHVRDTDSDYVMKKPSRCWLGAVTRYWKVVASCFHIVSFAEHLCALSS